MKKTSRFPLSVLSASLILPAFSVSMLFLNVFSPKAMAETTGQSPTSDLTQKVIVKSGVLIPFEHMPNVAKGFFIIENKSEQDMLLSGVTSPVCEHVNANHSDNLRLSNQNGGDDIFRHLAIPRASVMVFPKEGYHLICYGLKPMQAGQTEAPFTFHFRGKLDVTTNFTLRTSLDQKKTRNEIR